MHGNALPLSYEKTDITNFKALRLVELFKWVATDAIRITVQVCDATKMPLSLLPVT